MRSAKILWFNLGESVTLQDEFGGAWTQQKLEALGKYLQAYTRIFKTNPQAKYYSISYVDAFAGTGTIRGLDAGGLIPELKQTEEQFRKGSVKRALEVDPTFDEYIFIEKSAEKCKQLEQIAKSVPDRSIRIINEDANSAILKWCRALNPRRQRAVVFLDPFGASVRWEVIAALGATGAVDLWVLFPYFAINRMLVRDRKPDKSWSQRLTEVFGTPNWENKFYSTDVLPSLLDPLQPVEQVHKSADYQLITDFFVARLRTEFRAVSQPLPLHNSRGSLLFILFFAAGNERSAKTGLKIANGIIGK
jgi:three-Cys-motif partner protein